jgi:hypothetical protein
LNQHKHPENDQAFKVGEAGSTGNHKKALAATKPVPGFARDEKPPNSMKHDGKKVTMRFLLKKESGKHLFCMAILLLKQYSYWIVKCIC